MKRRLLLGLLAILFVGGCCTYARAADNNDVETVTMTVGNPSALWYYSSYNQEVTFETPASGIKVANGGSSIGSSGYGRECMVFPETTGSFLVYAFHGSGGSLLKTYIVNVVPYKFSYHMHIGEEQTILFNSVSGSMSFPAGIKYISHNWKPHNVNNSGFTYSYDSQEYTFSAQTAGTYSLKWIDNNNAVTMQADITVDDHVWNKDYTVDKKATCTKAGSKSFHCSVCGEIKAGSEVVIPATGHNWDDGEVTAEPTCINVGAILYTCTTCKDTKSEAIKALGHDWDTDYTIDKMATCTEEGKKSIHCSRCSETKDSEIIPALGHSFTYYVSNKDATCEKDGTKTAICDRGCGANDTMIEEGSALGHEYESAVTKQPTCTDAGVLTYTCKHDSSHIYTEEISALGHSWNDEYTVDKEATCTESGSKSYHCSVCGEMKEDSSVDIPASGHDWDNGEVSTEPTCTKAGVKTFSCNRCKETRTEKVDAIGHDFSDWETVDEENHQRICKHDGSHVETVPHAWDNGVVTTEPSRGKYGIKTYTCSDCKATRTEVVKATVNSVTLQIESLPNPAGIDDEEEVKDAVEAYSWLSDEEKAQIPNELHNALTTAETQVSDAKALAKAKEEARVAINDYVNASDYREAEQKTLSEAIKDALEQIEQASSPEEVAGILSSAETTIDEIKTDAQLTTEENKAAAEEVQRLIDAIPTDVLIADDTAVEKARAAYEELNDAQKAFVPINTVNKLEKAEVDITAKKIEAIANIGNLSLDDAAAVEAAKKAYDALSEEQKKQIDSSLITALSSAEKRISELDEEAKKADAKQATSSVIYAKKVTITGESRFIAAGKKIKLTAIVLPKNVTKKGVTWTSSNKKYATVSSTGLVKTKKYGKGKKVTIIAKSKDGKVSAKYVINIKKGVVKKIKLSGKKTVKAGKKITLKAKVTATKSAYKRVLWTSSNKKIATVNAKGVVKVSKSAKGKKVTITAKALDGSNKKAKMTIKVK